MSTVSKPAAPAASTPVAPATTIKEAQAHLFGNTAAIPAESTKAADFVKGKDHGWAAWFFSKHNTEYVKLKGEDEVTNKARTEQLATLNTKFGSIRGAEERLVTLIYDTPTGSEKRGFIDFSRLFSGRGDQVATPANIRTAAAGADRGAQLAQSALSKAAKEYAALVLSNDALKGKDVDAATVSLYAQAAITQLLANDRLEYLTDSQQQGKEVVLKAFSDKVIENFTDKFDAKTLKPSQVDAVMAALQQFNPTVDEADLKASLVEKLSGKVREIAKFVKESTNRDGNPKTEIVRKRAQEIQVDIKKTKETNTDRLKQLNGPDGEIAAARTEKTSVEESYNEAIDNFEDLRNRLVNPDVRDTQAIAYLRTLTEKYCEDRDIDYTEIQEVLEAYETQTSAFEEADADIRALVTERDELVAANADLTRKSGQARNAAADALNAELDALRELTAPGAIA